MRKRRVMLCDDDRLLLRMMGYFFALRGDYEVMTYESPVICPVGENAEVCANDHACADIIIIDIDIDEQSGIDVIKAQTNKRCKVPVSKKAIISERLDGAEARNIVEMGCSYFKKPIDFDKLSEWLYTREQEMDLSQPLGITRKEKRIDCLEEIMRISPKNREAIQGVAVNMSSSGMCVKIGIPLRQEETVFVNPPPLMQPREASVRWSRRVAGVIT